MVVEMWEVVDDVTGLVFVELLELVELELDELDEVVVVGPGARNRK